MVATAIGAGIAWGAGLAPLSFFSTNAAETASGAASEPDPLLLYALATPLGIAAGAILAVTQWRVFRRFVPGAASSQTGDGATEETEELAPLSRG